MQEAVMVSISIARYFVRRLIFLALAAYAASLYGQAGGGGSGTHGAAPSTDCTSQQLQGAVILSPQDTGEMVEGPICVGVQYNVLRYSAEFGRTVSFTAGPNLQNGFTPPASTPAGGGLLKSQVAPDPETSFQTIMSTWGPLDTANSNVAGNVAKAIADLKALVQSSDDTFRTSGPAGVIQATQAAQIQNEIKLSASATWNTADATVASLRSLLADVQSLLAQNPPADQKAKYTEVQTQINTAITDMTPSTAAGSKTTAFYKQQAIIAYWAGVFKELKADLFVKTTFVTCGVNFNQNKQVAVKLIEYDLLPTFDGQTSSSVDIKDPFVTVTCASPFSISAGVEMRFLANQAFGLVPSGTSGTNQFNVTDDEKIIPLPIAMVHARLYDWDDHKFGLHVSLGVGAHITSTEAGGSGAEYLVGFSLSLFRTVYITPGWHLGKVAALGGGYKVGDAVPTGVTTAPVQTSYQNGFGLAFTFTKP
jgi:hypothetical protein